MVYSYQLPILHVLPGKNILVGLSSQINSDRVCASGRYMSLYKLFERLSLSIFFPLIAQQAAFYGKSLPILFTKIYHQELLSILFLTDVLVKIIACHDTYIDKRKMNIIYEVI